MIKYEYISKDLIISSTARRVYRASAVLSLFIYPSLVAIKIAGPTPFLKQLLFISVVATAIITVGMEFFLIRFDDSAVWKQIFWFLVMIFAPLGSVLYCFAVYSRSKAVQSANARIEKVS